MNMDAVPGEIISILSMLEKRGYPAYLVGGCVRDMILGREINDWDIATLADCQAVQGIFPKTAATGIKYGTVTVFQGEEKAEVTTFRSDGKYADGRRPETVRFVSDIFEDLKRRDFTINAMALSAGGELIDSFGGAEDIKKRKIRCVGRAETRFSEDALRMFRALRFSAQLGFEIELKTLNGIKTCAKGACSLSGERIFSETEKILMSGKPEMIAAAFDFGLFCGFEKIKITSEQLRRITLMPKSEEMRWSGLCAVLDECGADIGAFLKYLRASAKLMGVCTSISCGERENGFSGEAGIKRLISKYGAEKVMCAAWADFAVSGRQSPEAAERVISSGECCTMQQLKINGHDISEIGAAPGKATGVILQELLEHVIVNPQDNDRDTLIRIAGKLKNGLT